MVFRSGMPPAAINPGFHRVCRSLVNNVGAPEVAAARVRSSATAVAANEQSRNETEKVPTNLWGIAQARRGLRSRCNEMSEASPNSSAIGTSRLLRSRISDLLINIFSAQSGQAP